jgi:hypothetical protein
MYRHTAYTLGLLEMEPSSSHSKMLKCDMNHGKRTQVPDFLRKLHAEKEPKLFKSLVFGCFALDRKIGKQNKDVMI